MPESDEVLSVLLIGAYANGNLGDTYQAEAVADALLRIDPTLDVSSVSAEDRQVPYPARNHRALPSSVIWDFDRLNSFDLILVGGGGLIAVQHRPLNDPAWVAQITTRVCALAIGVSADAAQATRAFIERCDMFSVRDDLSAENVSSIRRDVVIVSDPILLSAHVDDVGAVRAYAERRDVALVSGRILAETTGFYRRLEDELLTFSSDAVVAMNTFTDQASKPDQVFRRHRVHYATSLTLLSRQLMPRRYVLSERYHGCIFALKWGLPAYGIALGTENVTPKITELYRRLGLDSFLIRADTPLDRPSMDRQASEAFDVLGVRSRLERWREDLQGYLSRCLLRIDDPFQRSRLSADDTETTRAVSRGEPRSKSPNRGLLRARDVRASKETHNTLLPAEASPTRRTTSIERRRSADTSPTRLLVFPGAHRTGTGLLQASLEAGRASLLEQGVSVARRQRFYRSGLHAALQRESGIASLTHAERSALIEDVLGGPPMETVVISVENMFGEVSTTPYGRAEVVLDNLKLLFPEREIRAWFYTRRQDAFVQSSFIHEWTTGKALDPSDYVQRFIDRPIDWLRPIDAISKSIGAENLKIVPFESATNGFAEYVSTFWSSFSEHGPDAGTWPQTGEGMALEPDLPNVGMDILKVAFGLVAETEGRREIARQLRAVLTDEELPPYRFPDQLMRRLRGAHAQLNDRLVDRAAFGAEVARHYRFLETSAER